ncbi:MAG: type VI secretion system protein TssA [Planctomycetaceae bacterium]|nr:type VI secretion system protein TssA [Planctomycetaceae bacterium]
MASPEILDFDSLLQPISDESPSGVELKEDSAGSELYYQVKGTRDAASTAERQQRDYAILSDEEKENEQSPSPPDWRSVLKLATEVLSQHSKDLWVAAWGIEALCRLHGFPGLRDGFRLTRELSERFWDGIHPVPDEEGYLTTVAQLTGLNGDDSEGALITPIDKIPITDECSYGRLTSSQYRDAAEGRGEIPLEAFDKAALETSTEFFQGLVEDITQAQEEFAALTTVLEEKCGQGPDGYSAAPPSSQISGALRDCLDRVKSIARDRLAPDGETEDGDESGEMVEVAGGVPGARKTMTREDAFRLLLQVSEYFRKAEPHSPVSYSLEQAVRWGRMSLPDLLGELLQDGSVREDLFRRVGIPDPDRDD